MKVALECTLRFESDDDDEARTRARVLLEDMLESLQTLARYAGIWTELDEIVLADDTFHHAFGQNRLISLDDVLQEMKDEGKEPTPSGTEDSEEEDDGEKG